MHEDLCGKHVHFVSRNVRGTSRRTAEIPSVKKSTPTQVEGEFSVRPTPRKDHRSVNYPTTTYIMIINN